MASFATTLIVVAVAYGISVGVTATEATLPSVTVISFVVPSRVTAYALPSVRFANVVIVILVASFLSTAISLIATVTFVATLTNEKSVALRSFVLAGLTVAVICSVAPTATSLAAFNVRDGFLTVTVAFKVLETFFPAFLAVTLTKYSDRNIY